MIVVEAAMVTSVSATAVSYTGTLVSWRLCSGEILPVLQPAAVTTLFPWSPRIVRHERHLFPRQPARIF
jgi:hypothetical protein